MPIPSLNLSRLPPTSARISRPLYNKKVLMTITVAMCINNMRQTKDCQVWKRQSLAIVTVVENAYVRKRHQATAGIATRRLNETYDQQDAVPFAKKKLDTKPSSAPIVRNFSTIVKIKWSQAQPPAKLITS